ncbi:DUF4430 domain-containing protein [Paenibacillus tritici]|uniref:DUF4430 domain-containing protein n=2 Tax=Paenibacillus tritici TaxID=1873425 RepID=A0ABX2DSD0_9BACL|nr:DUF4430 domain-containing protein [Paenibacillus tritici]
MAASTSGAAPAGAAAADVTGKPSVTPAPAQARASEPAAQPSAGSSKPAAPSSAGVSEPATPSPAGSVKPAAPSPAGVSKPATPSPAGSVKPAAPSPAGSVKPAAPSSAGVSKPATPSPAGSSKPATQSPPVSAATPRPADTAKPENRVTLSITGDEEHGVILAAADYEIVKDESVLELTKRITRKQKIQMEYQGSKAFAYVEGIDNLYENDHGSESGWMYKVNGEFPSKAAGSWIVQPGDTIEWLYTLDLGKDLGAKAP